MQLKGTQGARAWPVLRLVKLELKGSVQFKSKVKICICICTYITDEWANHVGLRNIFVLKSIWTQQQSSFTT